MDFQFKKSIQSQPHFWRAESLKRSEIFLLPLGKSATAGVRAVACPSRDREPLPQAGVRCHVPFVLQVLLLILTDFRNYAALSWRPRAPVSVLIGPNGSGKTNLLEANTLLVPGRGLRGARGADLPRRAIRTSRSNTNITICSARQVGTPGTA